MQTVVDTTTRQAREIAPLEDVLAYKNEDVVYKFMESFQVTYEESEELFTETKKWLWLCVMAHKVENPPRMVITPSLVMLDKMWHTFILFTKDYSNFCNKFFGHYIHHHPTTKREKDVMKEKRKQNPDKQRAEKEQEYAALYSFVYDHLGEKTLVKWYSEYLDKYTRDKINQLWIKPQ